MRASPAPPGARRAPSYLDSPAQPAAPRSDRPDTGGRSISWCAARRIATPSAVLLALPVSMNSSVLLWPVCTFSPCPILALFSGARVGNQTLGWAASTTRRWRTIIPMNWIGWAILSAVFAAATALLAKVGVAHVDSNLAMALRTSVVVVFAWAIVFALAIARHRRPGGDSRPRPPHRALSRALRPRHRPLLALLLPRPATGPSLARRPDRQAQRPAGHRLRMAAAGRKAQRLQPSSAACSSPPEPW